MKLLFTYFVPSGGIETLNRHRARVLRRIGIESHLLYLWQGAGEQNLIHGDIPYLVTNDDRQIAELLATHRYDAVIASCDHMMLERIRGNGYSGPILYDAQGLGSREAAASTLLKAAPFIRRYARAIISPQTSHLMELFNCSYPDLPRFYLHNPFDIDRFHYRTTAETNLGGAPVAAWIGRLERNKNWELYLRICDQLARRIPNLQLWMFLDATIGDREDAARFLALADQLQLTSRILTLSNVPHAHMPGYLSAIGDSGGLLLSTSGTEGFGYAVAEAMSCRCPVVATDSDGVRIMIEDGRTGLFFRSGTVTEGVSQSLRLLEDRSFASYLRDEAYRRLTTEFHPDRYCADMANILRALGIMTPY
ncbi:glycosyltransferase family 4 protein [Paenibacillus kobensis]|uniref:glycosyltransferase family 4 protein n=1 Tax=Paenibacillus kobensis TaxID=59841 RepID=UPI000FD9ED91|nr:glycosyltransferase family 4 protein [Paenibacillus kobensis]